MDLYSDDSGEEPDLYDQIHSKYVSLFGTINLIQAEVLRFATRIYINSYEWKYMNIEGGVGSYHEDILIFCKNDQEIIINMCAYVENSCFCDNIKRELLSVLEQHLDLYVPIEQYIRKELNKSVRHFDKEVFDYISEKICNGFEDIFIAFWRAIEKLDTSMLQQSSCK